MGDKLFLIGLFGLPLSKSSYLLSHLMPIAQYTIMSNYIAYIQMVLGGFIIFFHDVLEFMLGIEPNYQY